MSDKLTVSVLNRSSNPLPRYATEGSAGADLCASLDEPLVIRPGEILLIPTGLFLALPEGVEAQVRSRSGMTLKHGVVVANGVGTIDSDYRGEVKVILTNLSQKPYAIQPGEKIAQLVLARYEQAAFSLVDSLDETARGEGGFGHSGK